jgi:hypothetical protein
VVRCGFRNGHQKDMCVKEEIGQCARNMVIIRSFIVNMILGGGPVRSVTWYENLHFDNV